MSETKYRLACRIPSSLEFDENGAVDIELFREGEWKHPAAPGGWFKVTKDRIQTFINNFNRGVCGVEIPLEFNHEANSEKTPGWVVKMYERMKDGMTSLWATLKVTDPVTRERVKNGSLKYISPTVVSDYLDTASGQTFEVIRSATLTNYPHIKGLEPAVVNFEEIQNQEEGKMKEREILTNNELQLEDLETITLEQLTNGDITLEYLTEPQIKELAEKFEMTVEQFQDKYPVAGTKMYGTAPRIKVPANVPPEKKKAFLDAFAKGYAKHQDMEKAMKYAMKMMGVEMEEVHPSGVKEFVDQVLSYAKRKFGHPAPEVDLEEPENATKFQELLKETKELRDWKSKIELEEDVKLVNGFTNMTPAAKKVVQALLVAGRNTTLKFEDSTVSLHDMLITLFEEIKKSPTINMFSEISHKEDRLLALSEDLAENIKKYQKDHPEATYRQAYDVCFAEAKAAGTTK